VSPGNLAVIHRVYEAMNRQDVAALEELAELYPEYEWRNGSDMPESQLRVGRESTIGYVRELFTAFDQTHTTIREVIDCGDAGAIFLVRHRVRGAVSGAEVERDEVHFWRAVDGRIAGLDEFLTLDEARAAAAQA
jgi:ketosteroid isomerase-like protein